MVFSVKQYNFSENIKRLNYRLNYLLIFKAFLWNDS